MNDNYIVGVDIGSYSIAATIGKADTQGHLKILGNSVVQCQALDKDRIRDIDNTAYSLKLCLNKLERIVNMPIDEVYVSIPSGMCKVIPSKGILDVSTSSITKKEVDKVLEVSKIVSMSEEDEIVDFLTEQYIVDNYDKIENPIGMLGRRLEVDSKVITTKKAFIDSITQCFNKCGIKIKGTVIQSQGIMLIYSEKKNAQGNTVFIDVGAEGSNVTIYESGRLSSSFLLPFGGENLTKDISICIKISMEEAEKIKVEHGNLSKENNCEIEVNSQYKDLTKVDSNLISDIISARIEEMFNFIKDELNKTMNYNDINNIVLLGGGISFFKGIKDFGENIFDKSVIVLTNSIYPEDLLSINALGIVKYVINELKLKYENREDGTIIKEESENNISNDKNFVSKIKSFLREFF